MLGELAAAFLFQARMHYKPWARTDLRRPVAFIPGINATMPIVVEYQKSIWGMIAHKLMDGAR